MSLYENLFRTKRTDSSAPAVIPSSLRVSAHYRCVWPQALFDLSSGFETPSDCVRPDSLPLFASEEVISEEWEPPSYYPSSHLSDFSRVFFFPVDLLVPPFLSTLLPFSSRVREFSMTFRPSSFSAELIPVPSCSSPIG